jgi:hypothetical protein
MATATALAATTTTSTMTTTIPCPSSLMSLSSGVSVFAALDQQWRWDGNRVAVVTRWGEQRLTGMNALVPLAATTMTTIPTLSLRMSSLSGTSVFVAME